jgi:predicted deacylase
MATLIGIDFELDGKQFGHLAIPHSSNTSAYGKIVVPVVYIRNGDGQRALISAGVHGDEFEGQIALRNLSLELVPQEVRGSLIILPMANAPAACSATRVSPIDQLNLNRTFPGDPCGSPTSAIADAIENQLLKGCGFAYDIHSGGSSLLYGAIGVTTKTGSSGADGRRLDLLKSLGLEAGMLLPTDGSMGFETSTDGAMLRKGVIGVSAEFGGGGRISEAMLQKCEESIRGFLAHTGIAPRGPAVAGEKPFEIYDIGNPASLVFSDRVGIFKADVALGASTQPGRPLGRIYDLYDLQAPPKVVRSAMAGTVLALRALPRTEVGDCLVQIGKPSGKDR